MLVAIPVAAGWAIQAGQTLAPVVWWLAPKGALILTAYATDYLNPTLLDRLVTTSQTNQLALPSTTLRTHRMDQLVLSQHEQRILTDEDAIALVTFRHALAASGNTFDRGVVARALHQVAVTEEMERVRRGLMTVLMQQTGLDATGLAEAARGLDVLMSEATLAFAWYQLCGGLAWTTVLRTGAALAAGDIIAGPAQVETALLLTGTPLTLAERAVRTGVRSVHDVTLRWTVGHIHTLREHLTGAILDGGEWVLRWRIGLDAATWITPELVEQTYAALMAPPPVSTTTTLALPSPGGGDTLLPPGWITTGEATDTTQEHQLRIHRVRTVFLEAEARRNTPTWSLVSMTGDLLVALSAMGDDALTRAGHLEQLATDIVNNDGVRGFVAFLGSDITDAWEAMRKNFSFDTVWHLFVSILYSTLWVTKSLGVSGTTVLALMTLAVTCVKCGTRATLHALLTDFLVDTVEKSDAEPEQVEAWIAAIGTSSSSSSSTTPLQPLRTFQPVETQLLLSCAGMCRPHALVRAFWESPLMKRLSSDGSNNEKMEWAALLLIV